MSPLEARFNDFIRKERLPFRGAKILLAVSGGVDSMVMAKLFHDSGFEFGVAHVNFGLRGKDSELDEKLVSDWASKQKIRFHHLRAETKSFAKKHRMSVQEAAREIRYKWLDRIAEEEGYELIATAHHLEDSVETFFINL